MTQPSDRMGQPPLERALESDMLAVSSQVAQVRRIVFDAVTKLGQGFERISTESNAQQELLENALRTVNATDANAGAIGEFIDSSRQLTGTMLRGLEQANRRTVEFAAKLEAMLPALADLSELSQCIRDSANQVRYLAMNATLEAGRSGLTGQGFAVVANAVKELALEFNEVSRRMDDNVDNVRTAFSRVAGEAKLAVEMDAALGSQARNQARDLEQKTQGLNHRLSEQLRSAQKMGRAIQDGVHLCVRGLQFGDLIGQLCEQSETRIGMLTPVVTRTAGWVSIQVNVPPEVRETCARFESDRAHVAFGSVQQVSLETGDIELF
jgi:methyl-accepting chemotaxis protein